VRRLRALGDQQPERRTLRVVLGRERPRRAVGLRAAARHRGHRKAVRQRQSPYPNLVPDRRHRCFLSSCLFGALCRFRVQDRLCCPLCGSQPTNTGHIVPYVDHSAMDLGLLADFILVAAEGGFGKAGRTSGRPKATLSRRVMALEKSLGVRLFERGARELKLTEDGRALHERTSPLLAEIVEAGQYLTEGSLRPRGRLKVSVPLLIGQTMLGRLAAEFCRRYPEVELEVIAEDRYVDLVEEGYDVAVRVNPRADASLVGRRVGRETLVV